MTTRTVLFLVHGLGYSARLWRAATARLDDEFECVALDLPGHGAAARSAALTVEEMADHLTAQLLAHRPDRWALVGHSMGGKIAAVVTARAERGVPGLTPPAALVLVSPSPLAPEPMADDVRARMIGWCADGPISAGHAYEFVDANTATQLPAEFRAAAADDVRVMSREAWLAWLERGSREDRRPDTPRIHTTTLVTAGAEDGPLGPDGQCEYTLPTLDTTEVAVIADAAHLAPVEQPDALAALIRDHVRAATARLDELPRDTAELMASGRVSAQTRGALLERLRPPPPAAVLDDAQRTVLRALLARVIPQRSTDIDLAARLDANLAARTSDGWRFADLPADIDAWRRGLATLADADFATAAPAEQDRKIEAIIDGTVGSDEPDRLTTHQMRLWFEDVRAEAVRAWLSHPAAQASIGHDGFANGGDGLRLQGYQRIGAGERDPWQRPLPVDARAARR